MNPSPAALAAAEEIVNRIFYDRPVLESEKECISVSAAIIDRHMTQNSTSDLRYFTSTAKGETWEWDGVKMFCTSSGSPSLFSDPDQLMRCVDAYETDKDGNRLDDPARDILNPL